jgi:hypothetical protein
VKRKEKLSQTRLAADGMKKAFLDPVAGKQGRPRERISNIGQGRPAAKADAFEKSQAPTKRTQACFDGVARRPKKSPPAASRTDLYAR